MRAEGSFDYAETADAQVRLPYEGDRLSMLAVLPSGTASLERLELSAGKMSEYVGMLEPREVLVSLPKFEMRANYDLKQSLTGMGMPAVFTSFADLGGGISDSSALYVDRATHDAYVKVNGGDGGGRGHYDCWHPMPSPHFNADRPFLFAVYDEQSGLILFMGSISDPSE